MATYFSYPVKIAVGNRGSTSVATTIADSSLLVDVCICKLCEIMNGCRAEKAEKPEMMLYDDEQHDAEVVGLTIECGDDDKVATLQLCYGSYGIIIQLLHLEKIPSSLKSLLADERTFVFVGVGVRDACAKLGWDYGLTCKSTIELAPMASRVCGRSEFFDSTLEELAHEIKGINIVRPTIPSLSLWGARDLRMEQTEYAITKAYASYSIGYKLMRGERSLAFSNYSKKTFSS